MSNLLRQSYSYIKETCPSVDRALSEAQNEIEDMFEHGVNVDGVFAKLEKSIKHVTEEFRGVLVDVLGELEEAQGNVDDLTKQIEEYQQQVQDLQDQVKWLEKIVNEE